MTSDEIQRLASQKIADSGWLREIALQLALLNEKLESGATTKTTSEFDGVQHVTKFDRENIDG